MILITGASGFIGIRLARRLTRARREQVTGLVHRLGTVGVARLATLPGVRLAPGDVRDRSAVDEAMRGCDTVVHCAVDATSSPSVQEDVTVQGVRTVVDAARAHRVRHIVFLSTAAVYSWQAPGRWNEDAPVRARDFYTRSKLAAEAVLLNNHDVPVTVLRPTCVYGPFSRTWTVSPVAFLRLGVPLVAADNAGKANLIYVDNLVDLILAALDAPSAAHRVYLANEEEPTDWETLYSAYARTIDVPLLRFAAARPPWRLLREEISVSLSNGRLLAGRLASDLRAPLLRGLATCHRHVPLLQRCGRLVHDGTLRKVAAAARHAGNGAGGAEGGHRNGIRPFAPRSLREFYSARATFSAERAQRELGWSPKIGAGEAVDRTCAWIRFAGL